MHLFDPEIGQREEHLGPAGTGRRQFRRPQPMLAASASAPTTHFESTLHWNSQPQQPTLIVRGTDFKRSSTMAVSQAQSSEAPSPEHQRLAESDHGHKPWKRWGPYLSERQWGTVREDDSPDGQG